MDKVRLLIEDEEYWVEGSDFDDMLDMVKSLPDRRYDLTDKVWIVAGHPRQVAALIQPLRLMHLDDDDPLIDSAPIQVRP